MKPTGIKADPENVWFWYQHAMAHKQTTLSRMKYCKKHNIEFKKFANMCQRIIYKSLGDPKEYAELCAIGRAYMNSNMMRADFVKKNDVEVNTLQEIVTHLRYQDIIAKVRQEKEGQMNFIQVPCNLVQSDYPAPPEGEIVVPQNDLEISITQGVKVCISPNIDSMKIMKIIELLKDL